MTRPLIGIPLDYVDPKDEPEAAWYSHYPWYALRYRYHDALVKLGAIPFFIGHSHDLIPDYLTKFDGLIIGGGHFDHDPELYTNDPIHPTLKRKSSRCRFEKALLEAFIQTNKPVLGICGGHQLINILHGGSLYQDVPSDVESNIKHTKTNPPTEFAHTVEVQKNTKLFEWFKETKAQINSSHHQAINKVGEGLVVNAIAEDGIIEGIEDPNHPFCFGVQWHPEHLLGPLDELIIEKFVSACQTNQN